MTSNTPDLTQMNTGKIAVIIPVYNIAPYIGACLDSLLAQTYPHWVAYVIDDGSTDASAEIVDQYAAKDSRFKVFHKPNGGIGSARNWGLSKMKPDMQSFSAVTFLDGDDWLPPNIYSDLLPKMASAKADILFFGFKSDFPDKLVERKFVHQEGLIDRINFIEAVFSYENWAGRNGSWGVVWNKIFHPEVIADLQFIEDRTILEDELFCFQAALRSNRFYFVNESYYFYRKRTGSTLKTAGINARIARGRLLALLLTQNNKEIQERIRPATSGIFLKAKEDNLLQFFKEGSLFARVAKETLPIAKNWHEHGVITDSDYHFFQVMASAPALRDPINEPAMDFLKGLPAAAALSAKLMLDEIQILKKNIAQLNNNIANIQKKLAAEQEKNKQLNNIIAKTHAS
jgi:glycosyltransferase involved in cell wall biosynthesis